MCKLKHNYKLAAVIMGLVCIFTGVQMIQTGHEHFGPYFHAYRKWIYPELKNRITPSWTFDDLAKLVVIVHGCIMCAAGVLIALGNRVLGPILLIFEMEFLIVLQDNPLLINYIKPAPKNKNYKWADLTRHLSVIGVAILLMAASPVKDSNTEEEENKKKVE